MATSQMISGRSLGITSQSKQQNSHARSRSISIGQLPRSFEHGEDFLAQSAAAAYQNNPAYLAIEKETLNAVAPFLEISKKRDRSQSTSSSSPFSQRSYTYGQRQSSDSSVDLHCSPQKVHNRSTSDSSGSYDESRSHVRNVSALPASTIPEDSQLESLSHTSSAQIMSSDGQSSMTKGTQDPVSHNRELSYGTDLSDYPAKQPLAYLPAQLHAFNALCGLNATTSQELELVQTRLKALGMNTMRSRKSSVSTVIPIFAQDSALLLTKFVYDSVRLYSPSQHEIDEKTRLQMDLEAVLQSIQPTASLVLFGSVKNGLALANADLDLMVVDKSALEDQLHDVHVDLPGLYAEALRTQGYSVRLLTKTRIPLIKIQREYIAGAFSVDISFDNPLAIHNTSLMATYNACDPRIGVLVMFIKLWARARRINDAFAGTLKSYGYMIMLIYYLQNKVTPALLPNLQMIAAPGRPVAAEELECQGFDIWFAKDVSRMHAIQQNTQSVGELLEGFFSHFAYEFDYRDWVITINVFGGLQTKEAKRWTQLVEHLNENGSARVKDRFILCIADPFEISHNVARTVTRAGLYEIRGAFMAAIRAIRAGKLTDLLTPSV